jgi:hypothetical protein
MELHLGNSGRIVQESHCGVLHGQNSHSKSFFENAIASEWRSHVAGIVRTGDLLHQAATELDRDVFCALKLPFSSKVVQMLRRIAANSFISNPRNHGSLPPCWRTLYELCKVSDDVLKAACLDGRLHPDLQRKDIRTAILGLSSKPASEKPDPVATVLAGLRGLSDVQLTAVWTAYGLAPFLRTISADMRSELERRIAGLRSHTKSDGPVLLRASEALRLALSHIRIAAMPDTTPANFKLEETQAMQALRAVARMAADIDTDCITIVNKYAKENRCAKTKKARRAA